MSTTTISFTIKVNNVLTDATSAVLSDPTSSFGVRRTDTNALVVADSTALSHDGTGLYSYTFTDPAAGLTYEAWMEWVYLGETYRVQKFSYGTPAAAAGYMTISAARLWLQNSLRGGSNVSQYTTAILDQTIMGVGNKFVLDTNGAATRTTADLSLTIGSSALPSLAGLTGFRPEYMRRAYITNPPALPGCDPTLHLTDYATVLNLLTNRPATGFPQFLAFDTTGTASVYPSSDGGYTLRLVYQPPFTSWSAGTADGPTLATALNIPDEYLQGLLQWLGRLWLQGHEPENKNAMRDFKPMYDDWVKACMNRGIGTLGAQVSYRSDPRAGRRGRRVIDGSVR